MNSLEIIRSASKTIKLIMPLTPSNNEIKAINRFSYAQYVETFAVTARTQIEEDCPVSYKNVGIFINRFGTNLLDYDNLVGGCKPLIDALTESHGLGCSLIKDDSPKYILYNEYLQTLIKDKGERFTHVTILIFSDEMKIALRNYQQEVVSELSK